MTMKKFLLSILLMLMVTLASFGQTTLISPTGDGGFETGATFALNNWTAVNGAVNNWWVGAAPVPSAGVNCAFTGTNATTWTGDAASSVNHIYRDIVFPAGQTSITLSFKYKLGSPDAGYDYLRVFLVPTTTTPVSGTVLTSGQVGNSYDTPTTYTLETISLPGSSAGTTMRLVFSWRTDGVTPSAVVAIDEISLVSATPPPPLTGIKTIDPAGSGVDNYTTFALAIADLNLRGVGTGGVTFNVASGATFAETPQTINATGTLANPIIFQKSGTAKPIINFTGTSGTTDACFRLNSASYITFNGLDIRDAGTSASNYMEYGFYLYGSSTVGCQNNNFKNCVVDLTKANTSSKGVLFSSAATSAAGSNSFNKFYNNDVKDCNTGYYIYGNPTYLDNGNEIGTESGGASLISNLGPTTSTVYAVYAAYETNFKIFNTTVTNIPNTTGAVNGFYLWGTGSTFDVFSNDIHTLSTTGANITAIYQSSGLTLNVYKNKIYDLSYSGTSTSIVYGMSLIGGTTYNIYNNFIYDLKATTATSTTTGVNVRGISLTAGTNAYVYYNTVYLNYTSAGATNQSAALYVGTAPTVNLRNNIFVNNVNATVGTRAVAFYKTTTSLTNISSTTNNNLYYCGTPGAKNLIFYDATNSDQTLAAYQTRVGPTRENASVTENPPFISGVSPFDLQISTTIPTLCESGGVIISAPVNITTDYFGNARFPNTGYPDNVLSPAVAPDLGANEFGGRILDVQPPVILYTALTNTSSTSARTLNVTVTDVKSGVPTTAPGWPTLYWRIGTTGSYTAVSPSSVAAGVYTYNFGAGVVTGNVVNYYVVAQDMAATPNIGAFPSAGAAGFTPNPPACSTAPTTPSTYTILATISGVFHVGVGLVSPNYVTLTAAVNDLNNKQMVGPVTFILDDANYTTPGETFPIEIKNNPGSSATNTLTIKPNTAVTPLITATLNAWTLVLNGAKYVTIDGSNSGGTDKSLTIENLYTTAFTAPIIIADDGTGASNNTLKNCIFKGGSNTSSNVYGIFVNYQIGNFANTTIQNNTILKAYYGMQFTGYLGSLTTGGVIQGNTFGSLTDAESIGYRGISAAYLNGVTMTNNSFLNFRATSGPIGITTTEVAGADISNNTFQNFVMATNPTGILLSTNTLNTTVNANNITGMIYPGSNGYGARGIDINGTGSTSSNISITNNIISNIFGDGDASLELYGIVGIMIRGVTGGVNVYHNTVNLTGTITVGTYVPNTAAFYTGSLVTAVNLKNNIFVNSISKPSTAGAKAYSIYNAGTNAVYTSIDYNDYFVSGTQGVLGYLGADVATLAAWKTATGQDVASQNIDPVFTTSTNLIPTAVTLHNLGTYLTAVPTDYAGVTRLNPSNMGAYEYGTPPSAWVLTTAATSVGAAGATLNGNGSANGATVITSFEYGLTTSYGSFAAATPSPITGIPTATFNATLTGLAANTLYHFRAVGQIGTGTPFTGADFTFTTIAVPTLTTDPATLITGAGATLNGTVNANGFSSDVTFEYGLTTAYGSTIAGVPGTVTGTTTTPFSAVVTGLLPLTPYHFRAKGVNSNGTSYGPDVTFTTLVMPLVVGTVSASQTVCTGQTPATLTSTPPNGSAPTYQWQSSLTNVPASFTDVTGANGATYLPAGLTTTTYFRQIQNSTGTSGGPLPTNSVIVDFVNYDPFVVGAVAASQTLCYGSTPAAFTSIPPNGTLPTYQWESSLTNIPANFAPISGATLSTYQPSGLSTTTYYRQIQNSNLTCGGPGTTNVITMQVYPVFTPGTIAASQSICSGTTPALLTGTPANGTSPTYQWQSSINNLAFTNISGATSLNYQPGALTSTTWFRTMENSSQSCGGPLPTNSVSVTIVVFPPLAPGTISASQGICSGQAPALLTGTAPNGTTPTYQWQVSLDNTTFADISGATSINYQPGALTTTTYYRTMQNASATCGGPLPTNVVTISMNPILLVGSINADQTICNNTAPALLHGVAPSNGTAPTYQWQSSLTNVPANFVSISGATLINYQPGTLAATTYFRQLQNATGTCTGPLATNVVTITVSAIPVATAANNGPVCVGSTLSLTGGPSGMSTYAWTGPNGFTSSVQNPTIANVTAASAGVYSLIATNSSGCISAAATTTVVVSIPAATATNSGPVCAGVTLYLVGGPNAMASYSWTGPNGFTSNLQSPTIPNAPSAASGVYTLMVTNTLGCTAAATTTAVIYALPNATATNDGPVCVGSTLNLSAGPSSVSYSWSGPNGFSSSLQNPSIAGVTAAAAGVYTMTATNALGCSASATTTAVVNAIPAAPVITETAGNVLHSNAPAGNQWYYSATSGGVGAPIAGATAQNYTATLSGYYWSIVTLNTCVSPESNHLYVIIIGIQEYSNTASLVIAPVPNDGKFNLMITSPNEDTYTVNIFNTVGQSIYELRNVTVKGEFNQMVDLRPVAPGIYTVILHGNNSHIVKKIVINK